MLNLNNLSILSNQNYNRQVMEISIVTGTYNRKQYLQQMVQSVRNSIGYTIPYEIVVVDGGSTDGTQLWCNLQSDIVLIEQGELLGAIKAFNAGAFAATGKYVLLANDDIEFIRFSILYAYSYMEDHPGCGQGCFQQDRNKREMHVEAMPVIVAGVQASHIYGQVAIVPKELGDSVGWWGDVGMVTYGGDNELACNILELGYTIDKLEYACIHDAVVDDALRIVNKRQPSEYARDGKLHPDTAVWLNKWTRPRGLIGPRVQTGTVRKFDKRNRVYYAPIYEKGHIVQHTYRKTLREALGALGTVFEYDYMGGSVENFHNSCYTFKPDIIILQAQDAKWFNADVIEELLDYCPDARLVCWNGDYHPKNLYDPAYIEMLKLFDLCGFAVTNVGDVYDKNGINWMYLQAGYEDYPEADEPVTGDKWDFVFLGNGYSKERRDLIDGILKEDYKFGLYGNWPKKFKSQGDTLYDYPRNYQIYNSARFAISDQQWSDARGYCSDRIFHAMRSGVCVLQQWFEGAEELMGLRDYENVIFWEDLQDLLELMPPVLQFAESTGSWIGKTGQRHVIENYSYDRFVDRMVEALNA